MKRTTQNQVTKKRNKKKVWELPLDPIEAEALELPDNPDLLFRFAVYGDNQRGIPIHRRVVEDIVLSGAEVVLHVGDYVQDGLKADQWDLQFGEPAKPLLENTVFLGVQGNHDKNSHRYYEIVSPPGGNSWFKAVHGPVAFFGLDSTRKISQQADWLRKELSNSEEKWKIAFFHEAPYSSSWPWPGGSLKTREHFLPILEEFGIELVFAGHIHNYERFHKTGIPYIITGGGGDTLSNPNQLPNPYMIWSARLHNFCTADVYADRIEVLARDLQGVPFDGITLEKENGIREVEIADRRSYTDSPPIQGKENSSRRPPRKTARQRN